MVEEGGRGPEYLRSGEPARDKRMHAHITRTYVREPKHHL
jgi:hypothetical protein